MPVLIPKQNFHPQEFFRMLLRQELSMVSTELSGIAIERRFALSLAGIKQSGADSEESANARGCRLIETVKLQK